TWTTGTVTTATWYGGGPSWTLGSTTGHPSSTGGRVTVNPWTNTSAGAWGTGFAAAIRTRGRGCSRGVAQAATETAASTVITATAAQRARLMAHDFVTERAKPCRSCDRL